MANIVAIQKPAKPKTQGSSSRPISLLSPCAKVPERLLPQLTESLPLASFQHCFRPVHSTTTALLPVAQTIAAGFNQMRPPSRSLALAVDLSKAFDAIPHNLLIQKIIDSRLPSNFSHWLACYLHGCTARVLHQRAASSFLPIRTGVPQGSVISHCLFNFFVSDYPGTADLQTSYGDDFTAVTFSTPSLQQRSGCHVTIVMCATGPRVMASTFPSQSPTSPFSPPTSTSPGWIHWSRLVFSPSLVRQPKILGVTLDTHFTFGPHIRRIADSARARLKILKALAGVSFGQSK